MPRSLLHSPALTWYAGHARDLPWRGPDVTPWGVLVSEIMLQQTPVARVLPVYLEWVARWPGPGNLAADPAGEAVRRWGRLGYPRRALRLHDAATAVVTQHGGEVPSSYDDLLALPGVGPYTAAAVASFAFGGRHAVLDTNVRRVLARAVSGQERPAPRPNAAERVLAQRMLPDEPAVAARWAVAVMELGALVCTARDPRCTDCPLVEMCAWQSNGRPVYDGPRRSPQGFAGTDRQVRGVLMAVLRDAPGPVPAEALDVVWADGAQRGRALAGLLGDGLVVALDDGEFALPGAAADRTLLGARLQPARRSPT
jgi:A/G-specific adenine glycosylase